MLDPENEKQALPRAEQSRARPSRDPITAAADRRSHGNTFLLSLPTLVWAFLLILLPMGFTIVISFASKDYYGKIVYAWTLSSYQRFLDPLYLNILARSVWLGVATTLLTLLIGYPLAYFIAKSPAKTKNILLTLVIAPFWTNLLIRAYSWMLILRNTGIINSLLGWLGAIHQPLPLLYNNGAVLTGLVYIFLPFMILPLYTTIEKLDWSLLEAAYDLGASEVRTFFNVTLPLTIPGIVAGSILVFIPAFGSFVIPAILGGAKSMMIGNLIENQFKTSRNWPFGSAAAVIIILVALLAILVYVRWTGTDSDREVL